MRRLIWPLAAGAIALWLVLAGPERPPTTPVTAEMAPPAGRPVALSLLPGGGFAVGGQGGGVALYDGEGRPTARWVAHGGAVRRIVPLDGDLITAGDGSVARWSITGERRWRRRLQEHTLNDVALVAPGAEGPGLVVGADRGSVARLDGAGWHRRGSHGRATFAVAASPAGDRVAAGGADGAVTVWTADGAQTLRWRPTEGWVTALAWTRAGLLVGDSDGRLARWVLPGDGQTPVERTGQAAAEEAIVAIAAAPWGALVGVEDGSAALALPDRVIGLVEPAPDAAPLSAVAAGADRAWTLAADRRLRAWDVTNGRPLATLQLTAPSDPHEETAP